MYIPSGTIIIRFNKAPLIEVEGQYLPSNAQVREISIKVENISKCHGGGEKIHARNMIVTLKLHLSLLRVTIRKPIQWDIYNIPRIRITSDQPQDLVYSNDDNKVKMIYIDK